MRIDAFAHALPPRYRARVMGLLEARGDETAQQYAWMLGNDPTLTELEARFALMDEIGADYRQVLVMGHTPTAPCSGPTSRSVSASRATASTRGPCGRTTRR